MAPQRQRQAVKNEAGLSFSGGLYFVDPTSSAKEIRSHVTRHHFGRNVNKSKPQNQILPLSSVET